MSQRLPSRPVALHVLAALMVFQGLSGLVGCCVLVADPSGGILELPVTTLAGSPFPDFLIPGLILGSVLGVFPVIVAHGLWRGTRWAWVGSLGVSVALIVWILVEIAIIGYHADPPLQAIYGALGVAMLALTLLPSVREAPDTRY